MTYRMDDKTALAVEGALAGTLRQRALAEYERAEQERRDKEQAAKDQEKAKMAATLRTKLLDIGIYSEPSGPKVTIDDVTFSLGGKNQVLMATPLAPCGHSGITEPCASLADLGKILHFSSRRKCSNCSPLQYYGLLQEYLKLSDQNTFGSTVDISSFASLTSSSVPGAPIQTSAKRRSTNGKSDANQAAS